MKKLIVYYGDSPVYVEGFPKECKRTCKGSLHIRPKRPKTVTDEEYKYITDPDGKYAYMIRNLKLISSMGKGDDRLRKKGEGVTKKTPDPVKPAKKATKTVKNKKRKKSTKKKSSREKKR